MQASEKQGKLTQEKLRALLDYDPSTGAFTWRPRPVGQFVNLRIANAWNARFAGKAAGRILPAPIEIGVEGIKYSAHRLAWLYAYGEWPEGGVDHVNQNPYDNRLDNLRLASQETNCKNVPRLSTNTSGVPGVVWLKDRERWQAVISNGKKRQFLGTTVDWFDAVCMRKSAENKCGYHPNHGRDREVWRRPPKSKLPQEETHA